MTKTIAALLICLCLTASLPASVVITNVGGNPANEYLVAPYDTFTSRGINYKAVYFPGTGITPGVKVTEFLNSETTFLYMHDSSGVEVELPPNVDSLSLHFGDTCWQCNPTGLVVNGVSSIVDPYDKLRYHNGTTLGGVTVLITGQYPSEQALTLTGPIQTFAVGGEGLLITDLAVHTIPEPTTMVSAIVGALFTCLVQRPRRHS